MPPAYPGEFRDDVVRVARNREPGVRLKDIAADQNCSVAAARSDPARFRGRCRWSGPMTAPTVTPELKAMLRRVKLGRCIDTPPQRWRPATRIQDSEFAVSGTGPPWMGASGLGRYWRAGYAPPYRLGHGRSRRVDRLAELAAGHRREAAGPEGTA